jgi:cytochrome c biogenesis protein CcdA
MLSLTLIGLVGGFITGISPCILPVLPVIFFCGAGASAEGTHAVEYRVIGGLVFSFSVVTLGGSAVLSLLHLPPDGIRWVALAALVAMGLGLIFPRVEQLLERPFSLIPQKQMTLGTNGFGLGLTLGVLYIPCAGPVLAAIMVAGATAKIGLSVVVLTVGFAVGTAVPLLFFALAGHRVGEHVSAFRRRQREIRIAAGVVTILLAVALVFNLPALLQRAIPDYTGSLQRRLGGDAEIQHKLNLGVTIQPVACDTGVMFGGVAA